MTTRQAASARGLLVAIATVICVTVAPAVAAQPAPSPGARLLVSTAWLSAHLNDADLSILHVGADRQSYDAGHIPGARFLPLSQLAVERDGVPNELPPAADLVASFTALGIGGASRVVVYGDQKGLLAARAFFALDYLGHGSRAALLDGGLEKWRAEGRPLMMDEPKVTPLPLMPWLRPGVLVTLPVVRDVSWLLTSTQDGPWSILDARPEAQFDGREPGPAITRAGHIPGAASLFWEHTLVSPQHPVLRPEPELRRMFSDAGAKSGRTVVTYCRTGVQASFLYFVARYLEIPVKMYDGSFVEWSRNADAPVVTGKP